MPNFNHLGDQDAPRKFKLMDREHGPEKGTENHTTNGVYGLASYAKWYKTKSYLRDMWYLFLI